MDEPLPIDRFDEPKIEALVETMVLAASADGDFSPEERARLAGWFEEAAGRTR